MPAQIVGGVTVGLAFAPVEETAEEIGDRARAFDGTMRTTVRARKRVWTQTTKPLTEAAANTLIAALRGTLPVAVSGNITGAVNTAPVISSIIKVPIGGGAFRVVVSYTLNEI